MKLKRKAGTPPDVHVVLLHLDAATAEMRGEAGALAKPDAGMWRFVFHPSPALAENGVTVNTVREQLRRIGEVVQAFPQVLGDGRIAFEFIVSSAAPESAFAGLHSQGVDYHRIAANAPTPAAPKVSRAGEPGRPRRCRPRALFVLTWTASTI